MQMKSIKFEDADMQYARNISTNPPDKMMISHVNMVFMTLCKKISKLWLVPNNVHIICFEFLVIKRNRIFNPIIVISNTFIFKLIPNLIPVSSSFLDTRLPA